MRRMLAVALMAVIVVWAMAWGVALAADATAKKQFFKD